MTTLSIQRYRCALLCGVTLFLFTSFAAAQVTPQTALTPEQKAFIQALGTAKPAPMSFPVGPLAPSSPGGLERFNPITKQMTHSPSSSVLATVPNEAARNFNGKPGIAPTALTPPSGAKEQLTAPSSPKEGVGGSMNVISPDITPTQPGQITYPYSFPFNTTFKLLMRFSANNSDYFYLCSGSSLASFHLLTAGHCLYNHDVVGDGSNVAGWAQEVWAWPAQTEVVGASGVPDFPFGVVKMSYETTYNAWINNSDFNWDFAWFSVDRRIGDHVGWMGRETGTTTASLNFNGYPAEGAYGFGNNAFQFKGYDDNNVQSYSDNRINLSAYVYGGHSGGPVWRFDGTNRYVEGVNSTSDRAGNAQATRLTSTTYDDIANTISSDETNNPPVARPYFIEYSLQSPASSKGLVTPTATAGGTATVTYNLFNAGFAASSATVYFYLSSTPQIDGSSMYLGSVPIDNLDAYTYFVSNATLSIPASTPLGSYYVVWTWGSGTAEYATHFVTYYWGSGGGNAPIGINDNEAAIVNQLLAVNAPAPSVYSINPSSTLVGSSAFTLTVNGNGFFPGSVVRWNGSNRSTTYLSSTQLLATISASDVNSAGTAQVTVFNYSPGGGSSSNAAFNIDNPAPFLSSISPISAVTGGAAFTLTVNGAGFVPGSVVAWNGFGRSTTFVSSSQLRASISATDIATSATDQVLVFNAAPGGGLSGSFPFAVNPTGTPALQFIPITPCRVADTRNPPGPFGGPILGAGSTRSFAIPSSSCGIPSTAAAYSVNVTVVPTASLSYLTVWPSGQPKPSVSTLNSDGRVKANAAIVPAGTSGAISVYVTNQTHFILDIDGYFAPAGTPSALSFFPLPPCRLIDTRGASGPLGGPFLSAGASRAFPLLSGSCGIPASARAYSLNVTALPHGPLGFITTWPTGQARPVASTLNAPTGTATANAAIVPAGVNDNISMYTSNDTDLLVDINGYFASNSGGLYLYNSKPCRAADTRNPPGTPAFSGTIAMSIQTSGCGAPSSAKAYVLNATVVPPAPLGWLTLWPNGAPQPGVSTLNAYDGAVTSNMAIVPTTNGSVDAFASNNAYLILDLSSYFAP